MLRSPRAIQAMLQVDRGDFCPHEPYHDMPVPLGYNATISAPHMHAFALEAAASRLRSGARVLDVGSGSGYLAVCFAELVKPAGRVVGIDHIDALVEQSIRNTRRAHGALLDSGALQFVAADGRHGYPPHAPYDLIHVGAASERIPEPLLAQLAPGGLLIIPVGEHSQAMRLVTRGPDGGFTEREGLPVRYVPLTDRRTQLGARGP